MKMNILLTSIGRRTYLVTYFKNALGGNGKIFVSNSEKTIALHEADGFFITPLIYDDNYIPSILDFCKKNNVKIVISVFDIDLLVLAKSRDLFFQNGIRILLAEPDKIEICNDKWKTHLFLESLFIKTPKQYLTIDETLGALKNKELSFPIIVKPRWGMASIGIYLVDNEDELRILSAKCQKEINNSCLKYESSFTPDKAVIYQEKLTGQEYGLDIINDLEGNYVRTYAKAKLTIRAGETDLGKTVSAVHFEEIAKKISAAMRHEVICSVDCFLTKNNEIFVIEMNCRISGHYPLSHLAGVNLPKQIIKWYNNEGTDENLLRFKEGLLITKDLVPVIIE
jgi:carbamoyl-phosphate synthase large subunit